MTYGPGTVIRKKSNFVFIVQTHHICTIVSSVNMFMNMFFEEAVKAAAGTMFRIS